MHNGQVASNIFLSTIEIKDCNVIINGQNRCDQPVKLDLKTFYNMRKT